MKNSLTFFAATFGLLLSIPSFGQTILGKIKVTAADPGGLFFFDLEARPASSAVRRSDWRTGHLNSCTGQLLGDSGVHDRETTPTVWVSQIGQGLIFSLPSQCRMGEMYSRWELTIRPDHPFAAGVMRLLQGRPFLAESIPGVNAPFLLISAKPQRAGLGQGSDSLVITEVRVIDASESENVAPIDFSSKGILFAGEAL